MTAKTTSAQSKSSDPTDSTTDQTAELIETEADQEAQNKLHAEVEERQRMMQRLQELKTEKLRRQVADMEAEIAAEEAEAKAKADAAQEGEAGAATAAPEPAARGVAPPVPLARTRPRHFIALASFVLVALVPVFASGWYLWTRAQDRYVSYAGFSVRTEEIGSAFELLGGVAELSGSSSSDTDILYKFIQSPELVARADAQLDLRQIWGRPGHDWSDSEDDPMFAYNPAGGIASLFGVTNTPPEGTIEDLTAHWARMVKVYSDSGTGLIDLEVQAFTADEAQAIAQVIYDESSAMINRLSAIARADATAYARDELDQSVERLKTARQAMTRFRNETQIVDPSASIQGQMGILTSLQSQLAQTLIDLDILVQTTREGDPRITQTERRVQVIEDRIEQERRKLGLGSNSAEASDENAFANLVGQYESLAVDLQFAEASYTAALSAFDSAQAEAQRQSRYLAAHVNPTLPQSSTRPDRLELLGLVALFAVLGWATLVLAVYALRDRR